MFTVQPDQTLCRIIKLFYQFGIWRDDEESHSRKSGRRFFHLILLISYVTFFFTCAFLSDDRNQQIFLIECAILLVVMTIKLGYLLWRKDEIEKFFYDPIVTHHCIASYGEWVKVNDKVKKILKFSQVYSFSLICSFIFVTVVVLPIFTTDKLLPFFIRFESIRYGCDYDYILYWLAYVYLAVGCCLTFVYNCAIILIWYIMFNYSIEYKLLGNQFRRLGITIEEKQAGKKSKLKAQNSFHQDLIALICAHRNLFDTVERFRSCFSMMFLTEIGTGALSICASTYNLSYNIPESFFQMVYFIALLLYAFFDIFLVMYLANEITIESDRLAYCLFESNWIDQPEKTKQCIIILCEVIKQPQQLVIFIYPMNLEKFTSIVNGAYSMFNILKNFNQ